MKNLALNRILFVLTFHAFLSLPLFAQQGKFEVIGYEKNQEAPLPLTKTTKDGRTIYDSRVIGSPKLFPGYIITISGEKIEGKVAVFNNSGDWAFVKRALLIVPEGKEKAQYLGSGIAAEIFQERKKESIYFDYYDGIYLQRLVSGSKRLSYNPAANTSRKVSSFVSKAFMDSIAGNVMKKSIRDDLENGRSIQESLEKAKVKGEAIQAFSEIEVVDKEYLLYDVDKSSTILITKNNYASVISDHLSDCPQLDPSTLKKYSKNYKKIADLFEAYNSSCSD